MNETAPAGKSRFDSTYSKGILDAEQLEDYSDPSKQSLMTRDRKHCVGPFDIKGCNMFALVYLEGNNNESLTYSSIIYQLPNSNNVPMIGCNW